MPRSSRQPTASSFGEAEARLVRQPSGSAYRPGSPSNRGSESVISNQGAFEATNKWSEGLFSGSPPASLRVGTIRTAGIRRDIQRQDGLGFLPQQVDVEDDMRGIDAPSLIPNPYEHASPVAWATRTGVDLFTGLDAKISEGNAITRQRPWILHETQRTCLPGGLADLVPACDQATRQQGYRDLVHAAWRARRAAAARRRGGLERLSSRARRYRNRAGTGGTRPAAPAGRLVSQGQPGEAASAPRTSRGRSARASARAATSSERVP